MEQRPHIFRRRYYLKGSIQPQLIRRIIGLFVIMLLLSASVFFFLADKQLENEYYKAHQTLENTRDAFLPWLIGVNLAAIALTIVFAIFPSHKVAGPVYRIQNDLRRIKQGEFPRKIRVRKKDLLKELAADIDDTMKSLGKRIKTVQSDLAEIDALVRSQEISSELSSENLENLKRMVSQSVADINYFRFEEQE